jgi:hypothetical protein
MAKFGSAESEKKRNVKTLLLNPDLIDYNSLATMDSLQMKSSKVSFLWNCDSPVNRLMEL